ncbi:MAG: hypothetical protein BGO70_06810 [Bacteroidetes bacterium 43-93]|nr:hypothetical protein [Bacteroidota bacterium]OJW97492.1 MAG: hypothetical protein BGO70_06810 [Bacteroidetes bacterium 43-93]
MKKNIGILALLYSVNTIAQTTKPLGSINKRDSNQVMGSLHVDSVVRLLRYATTDTCKVIGIDSLGNLQLRDKCAGISIAVDSNTYATVSRLKDSIGALDSRIKSFGYLATEVDGSITNELQTLSLPDSQHIAISNGNTIAVPWLSTMEKVDSALYADTAKFALNASFLNGFNSSYFLNRANHTGTQQWNTITATPTTIGGYGITDFNSLWDARLATKTTTNLAEGSNLYWTNSRFDTRFNSNISGSSGRVPVFTGVNTLGNGVIRDNGSTVGITVPAQNNIGLSLPSTTTIVGAQIGTLEAQGVLSNAFIGNNAYLNPALVLRQNGFGQVLGMAQSSSSGCFYLASSTSAGIAGNNAAAQILARFNHDGSLGIGGYLNNTSINDLTSAVIKVFPSTFNVSVGATNNSDGGFKFDVGGTCRVQGDFTIKTKAFISNTTAFLSAGTGSPNAVISAPVGSVYTRTDGSSGATFYVKESGTGNTGWVAHGSGATWGSITGTLSSQIDLNTALNAKAATGINTDISSVTLGQSGLNIKGASANTLTIKPNETLTANRLLNLKLNDASRSIDIAGDITLAGSLTTSGANALTLTTTGATNIALPLTGTLATIAGTETLTNKTLTAPVISSFINTGTMTVPTISGTLVQYVEGGVTSSATPAPQGDGRENYLDITALATNASFSAPSGTAVNHNTLLVRIKDNGTTRALSWAASYRAGSDFALPTTTVAGKTMYIMFVYNGADSKWDCTGLTQGF